MSRPLRRFGLWAVAAILVVSGLLFVIIKFDVQIHRIGFDSGSMEPTLPAGALIITYQANQLAPRDIITFRNEKGGVTTHTFLGYASDGSLRTKGDANSTPDIRDVPLRSDAVIGKVWRHVDIFTVSFWQSWRGLTVAVCMLLLGVAWWLNREPKKTVEVSTPA